MKKHPVLAVIGIILAAILVFFAVINLIPPKKNVESNPFLVEKGQLPMIAAHRGGGASNPENTLLAFREAVNTIGAIWSTTTTAISTKPATSTAICPWKK